MNIAQFKSNAIINILGWLLPTVIFVLLTPFMLNKLGTEGFGVVAIIQVVTGYMTMLNFGFSEAIIKSVAEYHDRDNDHMMRILLVGLCLFLCVGIIGGIIIYSISDWLVYSILSIPDNLKADAVAALKIGSLIFFLQMIGEFYRGYAIGFHRFDVPNICRIIRIFLSGLLIVYVLSNNGDIADVMEATLVGLVIGLVINVIWMRIVAPIKIVGGPYKELFIEIFNFSKHVFSVRFTGLISSKVSHFFLGSMSSVANVALYEIPVRIGETGAVFMNRVLQVLYPGFSSLKKDGKIDKIQNMVTSVFSIQLFLSFPAMIFLILEGSSILSLWINDEFARQSTGVLQLVAITYMISSLTNLPAFTAMSFDMPKIVAKYSFIRMVITLVLVYPCIKYFGLMGAAMVLFIAELQAIPFIYEVNKKIFNINIYKNNLRVIAIHLSMASAIYILYEHFYKTSHYYHPMSIFLVILVYFIILFSLGVTSIEDNKRMKKLIFNK